MKYNLKKPCAECPFKKDSAKGWLGGETVQDTFSQISNEGEFACHTTRHKKVKEMSRCRGSLLFLKKNGKLPKYDRQLAKAVSEIKRDSVELINILDGKQFFEHHTL